MAVKFVIIDDSFLNLENFNKFQSEQLRRHCAVHNKEHIDECVERCASEYGDAVEKYCATCDKRYDLVSIREWRDLYASKTREFWTSKKGHVLFVDFQEYVPEIIGDIYPVSFELLADYYELIANDHS